MKSKIMINLMLTGIIISCNINAQVTTLTNGPGAATDYLGWNAAQAFPLLVEHKANQPIHFKTNAFQRMLINNGGNTVTDGYIAIGNNLPAGFVPQARFHIYHNGTGTTNILFNNTVTGSAASRGFEIGMTSTGEAYFNNYQLNRNFTWSNGATPTPFARMRLNGTSGNGQATGRLALGNDLATAFIAVDRLTAFEAAITGSVQARFQSTNTSTTSTDGYAIGVDNSNRVVNHTQFEDREMRWLSPDSRNLGAINEWMRIDNRKTSNYLSNTSTDGFVGLNETNPNFHLDGTTPWINSGGELFLSFRTNDVLASRMGLVNAATLDNVMQPTFFGNIDSTQIYTALQTVGAIKANQDIFANEQAITRFISGREWQYNITGIQDIDEVQNRNLFSWQNGNTIKMHMTAQGQLRIGTNLNTFNSPPRNRLEISADPAVDPYGSVINTNGASGVRLTHMTSTITPITNPGIGVLSVDTAGNVIYVPDGGNFGADCGSSSSGLLPNDWHVGMNGNSVNFDGTGNVNIGDLAGCVAGSTSSARLWVRNTAGSPNPTTGFQVNNVGGAGTYAGYFDNGDVFCTNNVITAGAGILISDQNVKTNVITMSNSMDIINQLRPVSYKLDNTNVPQLTFDNKTNYGFIAQEVGNIIPELVHPTRILSSLDSLGNTLGSDITLNGLNYTAIIPFAIGGLQ